MTTNRLNLSVVILMKQGNKDNAFLGSATIQGGQYKWQHGHSFTQQPRFQAVSLRGRRRVQRRG
jgi:hypothetical protein